VLCLLGLLITHELSTGPFHTADLRVDVWLAGHRTPAWNDITYVGTTMATTDTAIAVVIVAALLLRWRLGRWYESLVMVTVMAGELVVFLSVTEIVHRARPPVHRLDGAPPTSSFPSGHTTCAVALYGSLAIMAVWVFGRRPAIRALAALLSLVPVFVAFSRLYRGMHYPTDVLAGALTGGLWLTVVMTTLMPGRVAREQAAGARHESPPRPVTET
jgi:undecaprenyl-diphosphatase